MSKSYPYVFIHGMLGFGEGERVDEFFPYWGMMAGSILKDLKAEGKEAYAPSISSLGSAWDRACEIYAQLVGGTVDYGEAHSKKYGHERFGRTYEKALIPEWGQLDAQGKLNKIHILGHSFGGATVRMFSQLLAFGDPEERAASGDNVSPFFAGGKGDWVQSVTTIAGPHNGTTVIDAIGVLLPILKGLTFFGFAGIMGNTPANQFYDMCLDHWGITSDPRKPCDYTKILRFGKMVKAMKSKDNLYYDLSLAGARDLNKVFEANPDTYLFSISTSNSMLTMNGNQRMKFTTTFLPFCLTGNLVGMHRFDKTIGEELDDTWLESDGASNTASALHPEDEPFVYYADTHGKVKRGIWNVMPVYYGDHMDVVGGSLRGAATPYFIHNYYKGFFKILEGLDD